MAFIWSLSQVVRLTVLTFVAGLIIGLALGHRGSTESAVPERQPATSSVLLVAVVSDLN
jgi:hypothetical protein